MATKKNAVKPLTRKFMTVGIDMSLRFYFPQSTRLIQLNLGRNEVMLRSDETRIYFLLTGWQGGGSGYVIVFSEVDGPPVVRQASFDDRKFPDGHVTAINQSINEAFSELTSHWMPQYLPENLL